MRFVLVGGGTGGHFYPLMAIAESLKASSTEKGGEMELFYIGPDPYDSAALEELSITFARCPSGKLRRYRSVLNLFSPFLIIWGIIVALIRLFIIYPDAVMSKGGYTSVPVVIAAWLLRIPIVIHESDMLVGRANRLGARFARHIGVAYPETASSFPQNKTALVGIPVRRTLRAPIPGNGHEELGIDRSLPVILVLGGSGGAERINTLLLQSLDELLPTYSIIHQTGAVHLEPVRRAAEALIKDPELQKRYHPIGFLSAKMLHTAYGVASIVVSRAGSTTIFENALHSKPSILVPIPQEVSHDQRANAYAYAQTGAAVVIEEGNLNDGLLAAEISRIMNDAAAYQKMSEAARTFAPADAADKLAAILTQTGREHGDSRG